VKRAAALALALVMGTGAMAEEHRPRLRDAGFQVGPLPTGAHNAITDVAGVTVGQVTLIRGDNVRTGVTAIRPHGGNLFQDKVPAAFFRANGFGKFAGSPQIDELGEIESPVILTNTLNVAEGLAGGVEWTLAQPGNQQVRSVNVIVGETNDGFLSDIRGRHVTAADVRAAITAAAPGPVAEGSVGAGTGTQAFGWKGGIGTSSRVVTVAGARYTIGVLVQTNFGGRLTILGTPVADPPKEAAALTSSVGDGSIMMIVATDAPLSDRNLGRLARRAIAGLARTGSVLENGSGDFVVAFSTSPDVRRTPERRSAVANVANLPNDLISPLFAATADATEEAIYNAMFKAITVTGNGHTLRALPLETVIRRLRAVQAASDKR
jgi:D-aminopeptidase